MEDYVWTDGYTEQVFQSFDEALTFWNSANVTREGKLWHRIFEEGFLSGVTDVTPCKTHFPKNSRVLPKLMKGPEHFK